MYSLIYDETLIDQFESEVKPILEELDCVFIPFSDDFDVSQVESEKVLTWVGDEAFYTLLPMAVERNWAIGFLAHPGMNRFYRNFLIEQDLQASLDDILQQQEAVSADLMLCNGKPVLNSVMIGDESIMTPAAKADENIFSKFVNLLILAFNIRKASLQRFTLITAKEVQIQTAAMGVAMVYRPGASSFTRRVVGETDKDEASLHAVILAPRSMTQVLNYFITRVLPNKSKVTKSKVTALPDYAGYIRTNGLILSDQDSLQYTLDGNVHNAETLEVKVEANALNLLTSKMPEKITESEEKESIKTAKLPKGQAVNELCGRHLPWIYHVDQEEVKETFVSLKDNAQLSESFVVLMVLATVLATIGLFANSSPVIIGAMILAPMMSPIISLSMGVLRQNSELLVSSARTLLVGIFITLFLGVLATVMTPLNNPNAEISARLTPTLLDLGVAIFAGIAGAYASARAEVAKSLAGVAIAVALVPPLAVSAIGIGWWDWSVFFGAFLLFLTNLVGMVLAASAAFLVMGYSPFHLAKKGLLLILPIVLAVSVPLYISFNTMVKEQAIIHQLEGWQNESVILKDVKMRSGKPVSISAKALVDEPLSSQQVSRIKSKIENQIGQPIQLELVQAIVR